MSVNFGIKFLYDKSLYFYEFFVITLVNYGDSILVRLFPDVVQSENS